MWHIKLAIVFGLLGFVFTSRPWLNWLHGQSPEIGFAIKSAVILAVILALRGIDGIIRINNRQTIGVVLVYTAFVMIFNYQSKWIKESGSANVELQTADGIVYHRSRKFLNLDPEMARLITFVVVPALMVLVASIFIRRGQSVNLD